MGEHRRYFSKEDPMLVFKHAWDAYTVYLAFKFIESGLGLACALLGLLGRPGMWRVLLKHLLRE